MKKRKEETENIQQPLLQPSLNQNMQSFQNSSNVEVIDENYSYYNKPISKNNKSQINSSKNYNQDKYYNQFSDNQNSSGYQHGNSQYSNSSQYYGNQYNNSYGNGYYNKYKK